MPKQQLNPPQQAARLWSQESCSIFNNELMWLWPLALSLGKNNAVLINRCMQIQGTSKAKMDQGADLQAEEVGSKQSGGGAGWEGVHGGGSPLLFQQNGQSTWFIWKGSSSMFISKWLIYCSLVWMERQKKTISHHFNHDSGARWSGRKSLSKWNAPQFVRTTTIGSCRTPALLQLDGFLMTTLHFLGFFFLLFFLNYRSTAHPSAEGCIASELGYTTARQPAVESAALCREAAGRVAAALCGPVGELILI